jgi:SAM-dependent methyltransferase
MRGAKLGRGIDAELWRRAQAGHLATWLGHARHRADRAEAWRAAWRNVLDAVQSVEPIQPGERVLDIGCGLNTVLELTPGTRGYTLDPLAARLAPLGLPVGPRHAAGVIESLPFPDSVFDRAFLMNVLDHVGSPRAGLAEIARVLRPGGVLALFVDSFSGQRYLTRRLRKSWDRVRRARTKHLWVFSEARVQRLLREAGFDPGAPTRIPGSKPRRTFFLARRVS